MTKELREAIERDSQVISTYNRWVDLDAQAKGAKKALDAAKKVWEALDEEARQAYTGRWRARADAERRLATQEPSIILAGPNSRA